MHQMSRTNVIVRLLLMSRNYYDFNEYFILTVTDIVHQILLNFVSFILDYVFHFTYCVRQLCSTLFDGCAISYSCCATSHRL